MGKCTFGFRLSCNPFSCDFPSRRGCRSYVDRVIFIQDWGTMKFGFTIMRYTPWEKMFDRLTRHVMIIRFEVQKSQRQHKCLCYFLYSKLYTVLPGRAQEWNMFGPKHFLGGSIWGFPKIFVVCAANLRWISWTGGPDPGHKLMVIWEIWEWENLQIGSN